MLILLDEEAAPSTPSASYTLDALSALPSSAAPAGGQDPYALACVTNHADDAVTLFLEQYKPEEKKPRLHELARIYSRQVQEVEDAFCALSYVLDIERAGGYWLDRIGAIVGQPRDGAIDDDYRPFVRAKILALRSTGSGPDLYAVIRALLPDPGVLLAIEEYDPKTFVVWIAGDSVGTLSVNALFNLLKIAKGATIRLFMVFLPEPAPDAFAFAPGSTETIDALSGFGNVAETIGGAFAGVRA